MSAYDKLVAIHAQAEYDGAGFVEVSMMELGNLLAEVDKLRAAAPAKKPRAKKTEPLTTASMPEWLPFEAWNAFLEMRIKIKKPATDYAQKLLLKKLSAFYANDLDPSVILNQSIVNGWQDLYAPKEPSTATRSQFPVRASVEDQNRANAEGAKRLLFGQRPAAPPPLLGDDHAGK